MTADDDSCSSYDSVSATDFTFVPTNTVTDTDIDTSSCDPNDAFSQQLRIGRAVLFVSSQSHQIQILSSKDPTTIWIH